MSYAVKEIFRSLCGEGFHTGRAAVFVRLAGCSLWTGREEDRASGKAYCATFCDTDFRDGLRMDAPEIVARVRALWSEGNDRPWVVLTGGEPALQADDALVRALHAIRAQVAIETNGTRPLPPGIDWITVSPKLGPEELFVVSGEEMKIAYPQPGIDPAAFLRFPFAHHYLQPIDGPDRDANLRAAVAYCLDTPRWRLSDQAHKRWGLP
jgi:7-carboxy-7-deazaguanine synthase